MLCHLVRRFGIEIFCLKEAEKMSFYRTLLFLNLKGALKIAAGTELPRGLLSCLVGVPAWRICPSKMLFQIAPTAGVCGALSRAAFHPATRKQRLEWTEMLLNWRRPWRKAFSLWQRLMVLREKHHVGGDQTILKSTRSTWVLATTNFPVGSEGKESACNAGDESLIPGVRKIPRGRNGTPLQYSCQKNPWTEEPGGLQSMGHKESDTTARLTHTHSHRL